MSAPACRTPAHVALADEVQRLRAENADLRAAACDCNFGAAPPAAHGGHAAGCPAVERVRMRARIDCGALGDDDCTLDADDEEVCRRHAIEDMEAALDKAENEYRASLAQRARAGRLDAALARIQSLDMHLARCDRGCDPACPTATAKRAREER